MSEPKTDMQVDWKSAYLTLVKETARLSTSATELALLLDEATGLLKQAYGCLQYLQAENARLSGRAVQ